MISVQRSQAPVVRPRRLAHLLVFTPSVPESIAFYSCNLGLRISDRSGDGICFMHGIHGSDHHLIAFVKSSAPGLHHCFWDVSDINQIGMGAMQMADKGYSRGWGLGRHVLGSNYFHYVRDPWGSYSEYSADIDYIPLDHDWRRGTIRPRIRSICGGPRSPRISCIITRRMPAPATPRVAAPTDGYRRQYQEDQGKILAVTALPTASGAAPSMASSRAPGRFSKPFVGGATMARGPRNETPSLPDRGVMTPMRSSVTKLFRLRGGFQPDEHEGGKVMLKRSIATVLIGGKVLALGAMMSSTALAQSGEVIEGNTTVVETPSGSTVIVPGVAAEPSTPLGAVTEPGYPLLEQLDNDEEIARTLISQGFTDVHILREGPILTVNAQRGGQPIELVYSIANGSLISVDGVELRPAPDETGNGDSTTAATEDGTDPGDGADDNGGDETGDGTGGEGDGGTGDDAGSDGSDGSDGETGGADGGDSGSDGGSDGGEGEGDSGESNG
ncbi:VOC family protein [Paracoccus sp. PXZ]